MEQPNWTNPELQDGTRLLVPHVNSNKDKEFDMQEMQIPLQSGVSYEQAKQYAKLLDENSEAIVQAVVQPAEEGASQYHIKVTINPI